jgi:hypothetical protein
MGKIIKQCAIILGILAGSEIVCQAQFTATATTIMMAEGGAADVLLMGVDNDNFSIRIPRGYRAQCHPESRTIKFDSESGASAISVRFSTNYARVLPKKEVLGDLVVSDHPGASLAATSVAGTGVGPAVSFDLFVPAGNGLMLRMRDIYVSYARGSVQLTFSCSSADFDKEKIEFMQAANSFRLLDKNTTTNP